MPWAPFVLLAPELVAAEAIERAAIDGLVFGWMLQLAMAFPPVVIAWDRVGMDDLAGGAATVGEPPRLGLVAINAGVLALWTTAMPVLARFDDPLALAGLALVGLAWTLFVVELWGGIAGTSRSGLATVAFAGEAPDAD